jgi:hypothetical protein
MIYIINFKPDSARDENSNPKPKFIIVFEKIRSENVRGDTKQLNIEIYILLGKETVN